MSHDPFCIQSLNMTTDPALCDCARLEAVRADEREQAAQRVADVAEGREHCPACVVEGQEDSCLFPLAIAAARGEAQ